MAGKFITFVKTAAGKAAGEVVEITEATEAFCKRMVDRGKAVVGEVKAVAEAVADSKPTKKKASKKSSSK
jgi:hypothetical protein